MRELGLEPMVVAAVRPRALRSRSVADGLHQNSWIRDISGTLSVVGIMQFLHLVDITDAQELHPENADEFSWIFSSSGAYSSKSAYRALFEGKTFSSSPQSHLGLLGTPKMQGFHLASCC